MENNKEQTNNFKNLTTKSKKNNLKEWIRSNNLD